MLATRPKLLHLVHRLPYPPDKGDRIRSFHTLRYLSQRLDIHLACLADEPVPARTVAALKKYCRDVAIIPLSRARWMRALGSILRGSSITEGAFWSPQLAELLRTWTKTNAFDAVLASSSSMVSYLRIRELRGLPAIVDLVDVDSQKWFDYAAAASLPKRWLYGLEGRRVRQLEKGLSAWASGILLTTPAEVKIYNNFAAPGTATVVNNGVDLDYFGPASSDAATHDTHQDPSCVFVGAFDYKPNIEGASWFCSHVWPQIHDRVPKSKLYLVGRKPARAVQALGAISGVEVVGGVPDVRPWVARATVVVVPLRIARGVQNKVLEALAMAKAVVASPTCLGGLSATPGEELLAAETPAEWARVIVRLFDDRALRGRLGAAGRAHVEKHHCWDRCLAPLGDLLDRIALKDAHTVAAIGN